MTFLLSPAPAVLRPAQKGEEKTAFNIIEARVTWLEQKGISQWPRGHYLSVFSQAYFKKAQEKGTLWLLEQNGRTTACAVLLEQDERWGQDNTPAWYVHNLASWPHCPGAGAQLLTLAEQEAARRGKRYLRLDCLTGARKLNAYYRTKGYRFAGYWKQPEYHGNLRQKLLQTEDTRETA